VNYLLDTMIWLWSVDSVEKLNQERGDTLENGREEIYFFSRDCLGDKHQGQAGQAASSGAAGVGHTSIHGEAADFARYPLRICMLSRFTISRCTRSL
jgi:hypothetical protein